MLKKCLFAISVIAVSGCSSIVPLTQKECASYYSVLNMTRIMDNGSVTMNMTYDCKERVVRAKYVNTDGSNDTTFVNTFVNKWAEEAVCPLLSNPRITSEVVVTGYDSHSQKVLHKRFNRVDCR